MIPFLVATTGVTGSIIIAGKGPELLTIERLARMFEKGNPGNVVEIQREQDSHPIELVKSGKAHHAMTGQASQDLIAIPIAWYCIRVVVDFTDPANQERAKP